MVGEKAEKSAFWEAACNTLPFSLPSHPSWLPQRAFSHGSENGVICVPLVPWTDTKQIFLSLPILIYDWRPNKHKMQMIKILLLLLLPSQLIMELMPETG